MPMILVPQATRAALLAPARELVFSSTFLTGINPQIARRRGCDQNMEPQLRRLRQQAQLIPDEHLSPDSPNPRSPQNTSFISQQPWKKSMSELVRYTKKNSCAALQTALQVITHTTSSCVGINPLGRL